MLLIPLSWMDDCSSIIVEFLPGNRQEFYYYRRVLLRSNDMLIFDQHDILLRNMIYLTDVKCDIFELRSKVLVTDSLVDCVWD